MTKALGAAPPLWTGYHQCTEAALSSWPLPLEHGATDDDGPRSYLLSPRRCCRLAPPAPVAPGIASRSLLCTCTKAVANRSLLLAV